MKNEERGEKKHNRWGIKGDAWGLYDKPGGHIMYHRSLRGGRLWEDINNTGNYQIRYNGTPNN